MNDDELERIEATSLAINQLLAGLGPKIQSAILADCAAIWLSGFRGPNAEKVRAHAFAMHCELIRHLLSVNDSDETLQ